MLNEILKEVTRHLIKEGAKDIGDRIDHYGETPEERRDRKRRAREIKRIEDEKERMSNVVPALIWIALGILIGILGGGNVIAFIFMIIGVLILI